MTLADLAPASPPAPFYSDAWLDLWQGEAADVLAALPDRSVHAAITSPPYWGLRDYGTAEWDGGTDPDCDHRQPVQPRSDRPAGKLHGGFDTVAAQDAGRLTTDTCRRCGARRQDRQLGLERSPGEYVARLVGILREVRRVLRDDGLLWLNLGDSFAGGAAVGEPRPGAGRADGMIDSRAQRNRNGIGAVPGLKSKDLVGIPWRVAFALQEDGWWLRRDVIWAKPNPMPESVTDRPTSSHEYVFMLAKSARYYFDAEAVAEPSLSGPSDLRKMAEQRDRISPLRDGDPHADQSRLSQKRAVGGRWPGIGPQHGARKDAPYEDGMEARPTRNIRSVWTIATAPYRGAHFAAFPPALVRPMILASTSERGCCGECGAPWTRLTERTTLRERNPSAEGGGPKHRALMESGHRSSATGLGASNSHNETTPQTAEVRTLGWQASCAHAGDPVPSTVLDPFAGTGTVGMVAQQHSRRAVLIDLNGEYLRDHVMPRNRRVPLGL